MLQYLICQRPDLRQGEVCVRLQIIRKGTNSASADVEVELVVVASGRAGAGYVDAVCEVRADAEGFGGGDADDVLAFCVGGCGGVLGGGVDGVAEDLDDGFGGFVFEACEVAESRSAAVDAEGGDERGDGDECEEG